jgi:moderate conductance mechanosensitive channel
MIVNEYLQLATVWVVSSGLRILVVAILALVGLKASKAVSDRLFNFLRKPDDDELQKRAETLRVVTHIALTVTILAVAGAVVLGEVGVKIGPILAAAGVIGLAVGFGAQNLVQDVISGFFILVEDQIRVGDVIQTAGKGGLVEKVNLRMVVLRDLHGNVHYIRNGKIDIVTNMTREFSRYVFDIGVAYREDVDEVIQVIKSVDEQMRSDPVFGPSILEPIEVLGLERFADSAVIVRARTKTKPIKQWEVGREFNRRLKKRFDELGIEIPFPHQTVYFGQAKDGTATPVRVMMEGAARGERQEASGKN